MTRAATVQSLADELSLDAQNPWPGLTAFTEQQHEFFFGREEEAYELFRCIKRERLTVLFGKSGLGKTSLLQAGLFPQLRTAAYLPVYIRISYAEAAASLDSQLQTALEAAIQEADLAEVALPQPGESIWEYLHRRGGNLISEEGEVVTPVLIFDQFEECFTLGARKEFASRLSQEFLPTVADLVENRTPSSLSRRLKEEPDLARRYELESPGCRILITLREDYLPNLESLRDLVPSLVFGDNRMRLREMTGKQALAVVAEPNPDLVPDDVAEFIVRFVAGAHSDHSDTQARPGATQPLELLEVAPAILSLFCRQLNEERVRQGLPYISRKLVIDQGVTIIDDFYQNCIAGMHPAVRRLIEDRLLTKGGYRDNVDLAQAKADLQQTGVNPSCIDELVRLRLLQIEEHRGASRLELTHDVLADPVKRSRLHWEEEQARQKHEEQARTALAEAKQAEQQALQRARFLQKMAAGAVCAILLLAFLLLFALKERRDADTNAATANTYAQSQRKMLVTQKQMTERQHELAEQAEKEAAAARESKQAADEAAARAERMARLEKLAEAKDRLDAALATENEHEAKLSEAEVKTKGDELGAVSTDVLRHCISLYADTGRVTHDVGVQYRGSAYKLYEQLLMGEGHCFDLAKRLHRVSPDAVEITDSLSMIPLQAAASASDRGDRKQVDVYCRQGVALAEQLRNEKPNLAVTILVARTYTGVAWMLATKEDTQAGQIQAQRGLTLISDIRKGDTNLLTSQAWGYLAFADYFDAQFLKLVKNDSEAIKAYNDSLEDDFTAYSKDPKVKGYENIALAHEIELGDYERDLRRYDTAAQTYHKALKLALELNNRSDTSTIYSDLSQVLVASQKYDSAHHLLEERVETLSSAPASTQRDQDLTVAYADDAKVYEAQKEWAKAAERRVQVVKLVESLKPSAEQQKDLASAYSLLSWDQIHGGHTDEGIANTRKAFQLARAAKDRSTVSEVYRNLYNSLIAANQYQQARSAVNRRIQILQESAKDTEREQSLADAYSDAAGLDEAASHWEDAASDRSQVVKILTSLDPNSYDAQTRDTAVAYGNLSWAEIESGRFDAALKDARQGLTLEPSENWIHVNEAHALLFTGHPTDARDMYVRIKDIEHNDQTLKTDISDDFQQLCKLHHTSPQMSDIARELGIDTPELRACLANPTK